MKARFEVLAGFVRQQLQLAGVRNLVSGGVTGIAVTLANRAMMLVSAVILARLLGPDGYGVYAFAIAMMAILSLGTEFGMYSLLVREVSVANASGDAATVVGLRNSAFRFALISSAVIGALGSIILWSTPLVPDLDKRLTLTLMLLVLPANTIVRLSSAILNGLRRLTWAQVAELFLLPAFIICGLLIVTLVRPFGVRPPVPMFIHVAGAFTAVLVVVYILHRALTRGGPRQGPAPFIAGLPTRARPFLLIGAAGMITGQLDTVLVGLFLSDNETALYRVAAQGATLIWFGIQILQSISAPYFSSLYSSRSMDRLKRLFRWTTAISILSAAPISTAFIVFGKRLIELVFGSQYTGAYPLLVILTIGYSINVACGPIGSLLIMAGEERFVSRALVVSSALNVLMALVLIQLIGVEGVAVSTSFSIAVYHLVLRVYGWRRYRL